jgi:hypothetical protein
MRDPTTEKRRDTPTLPPIIPVKLNEYLREVTRPLRHRAQSSGKIRHDLRGKR